MKVGEYVRTEISSLNLQRIGKIKKIISDDFIHTDIGTYDKENIIKSSPNIIDLIEEHDILKIEEQKGVYTICEVEVFREPYEKYTFLGVRIDNRPIARKLYELNIKSIVTHEQFSQMEYRIGE